jgi:SAM-dependent methyltransferase
MAEHSCGIGLKNNSKSALTRAIRICAAYSVQVKTPEVTENFVKRVTESLANATFGRLVLSSPVADEIQKILARFVVIKGAPQLSLTLRHPTCDVTRNIPSREAGDWLRTQLGSHFRSALLCTTKGDWQFISNEAGAARIVSHKASSKKTPSRQHDEPRHTLLDETANDWLQGLGVLDRDGKLRSSMADKHRQISHYLEIFSHLAKAIGWNQGKDVTVPLQFADMGCGKGYLTFGLWHLFHRVWKTPVRVIGVEARDDLVSTTSNLAKQIRAEGLEFVRGTIESAQLPEVDALIALHACNTATDDAIRRGIELNAKLIVVAPCCHKELRPQMGKPNPLAAVLRHGLMEERMAEWATDGLRALFLEWAGYRTKLMEFVGSEHTPKNLLITAVREREPFIDATVRKQIEDLKKFFEITHHALDPLLAKTQTDS